MGASHLSNRKKHERMVFCQGKLKQRLLSLQRPTDVDLPHSNFDSANENRNKNDTFNKCKTKGFMFCSPPLIIPLLVGILCTYELKKKFCGEDLQPLDS